MKILFCLDANDFHAIDWVKKIKQFSPKASVHVLSDTFDGENKKSLEEKKIICHPILKLKKYNKNSFSSFANFWRNLVKLFCAPIFSYRLKKYNENKSLIFHAHSMYYIFICALANVRFVGTPMGSDVLVRPDQSKIYKKICAWSLQKAKIITVDSRALYKKVRLLCRKKAKIIQNGIATNQTNKFRQLKKSKVLLVSPRAIDKNYRIREIVEAKTKNHIKNPLVLFYPYVNSTYFDEFKFKLSKNDINLGKISKTVMYSLFSQALAVFSIPESDSSPRSVYEAIFCGAPVCTEMAQWVADLPNCMRKRVVICDLANPQWMKHALHKAKQISKQKYIPSRKAINTYDENVCMKNVIKNIYEKS